MKFWRRKRRQPKQCPREVRQSCDEAFVKDFRNFASKGFKPHVVHGWLCGHVAAFKMLNVHPNDANTIKAISDSCQAAAKLLEAEGDLLRTADRIENGTVPGPFPVTTKPVLFGGGDTIHA